MRVSGSLRISTEGGGQGLVYIALRVQREPLDQTDLSNGLYASLKAVGNRHTKQANKWGP